MTIHNSAQARRWCAGLPCAVCSAARPCPRKARPGGAHTEGEGTVWVPSRLESSQQPRPRPWACYWLIGPICACRCLAIPGATPSAQGPSSRRPGLSLGYTTCVRVSASASTVTSWWCACNLPFRFISSTEPYRRHGLTTAIGGPACRLWPRPWFAAMRYTWQPVQRPDKENMLPHCHLQPAAHLTRPPCCCHTHLCMCVHTRTFTYMYLYTKPPSPAAHRQGVPEPSGIPCPGHLSRCHCC